MIDETVPSYRELVDRVLARQPKSCPSCFDDRAIAPLFDGETWDCSACGWVWEEAR